MNASLVAAAVERLETLAAWLADRADRHGAVATTGVQTAASVTEAWTSPVADELRGDVLQIGRRHHPIADGLLDARRTITDLASTGAEVARRLKELEDEAEQVVAALRAATQQVAVLVGDPASTAEGLRRRNELQSRRRRIEVAILGQEERWNHACRAAAGRLEPAVEPLRSADSADRNAATRTAHRYADGYPHRFGPLDLDDPWFRALVDALLADPRRDPAEIVAELAEREAVEHLEGARKLIDSGGRFGMSGRRIDELEELVSGLPAPVADIVMGSLTDEELRLLVRSVHGAPFGRGRSATARHGFWTSIGGSVSLDTFRRIAGFTPDLDPPPSAAMPDSASSDTASEEWYLALEYTDFGDLFSARGDGQAHPFDPSDVAQGRIGNCYLIAAVIGVAGHDPRRMQDLVAANPNGTFTVTFGDGMPVTVTPDFPSHPEEDRPAFMGRGLPTSHLDVDDTYELWPMVIEKAYAQRHGGWDEIVGGQAGRAVEEVFGGTMTALDHDDANAAEVRRHLDSGSVVTIGTHPPDRTDVPEVYEDSKGWLVGGHAYVVTDVDARGMISLVNPWNPNRAPIRLTEDELSEVARRLQVNELP